MSEPWYAEGLRFRCTQCGRCCTGSPGYVWMGEQEIERLARFLSLTVEEFGKRYLRRVGRRLSLIEKANDDCIFWENGCTVYPARPDQCRTFPFWPENLESREDWDGVAEECPGVNRGKLYSVEEIERISRNDGETSRSLPRP
ncbi:MAG TPA: YkgJ family cysteine cluster protein [Planctomycetota bacterium]|nr:YkgJ family cysteine cluster protein [Planctomycetota bacterium]